MRDIEIVDSKSSAYTHLLKVGGREDGTGGAMALGFTYEEVYRIFKEAQKIVATRDPDASVDIHEEFDKAIEELNDARNKLEAIRGFKKILQKDYSFSTTSRGRLVINKLDKILGDDCDG